MGPLGSMLLTFPATHRLLSTVGVLEKPHFPLLSSRLPDGQKGCKDTKCEFHPVPATHSSSYFSLAGPRYGKVCGSSDLP